ncbi:hypothetical protein TELCIR_01543 [Teladorsagia circumcincta]|uniref:Reverse transcriptase domain-containing protein n=1 Tax=Teladorsagia circumcincta TaxID=45464 RepID=A0A2G9V1N6_TELCI|nr:hypothetical protein TELCIR_01543 [Teladorsagia circumcincta]
MAYHMDMMMAEVKVAPNSDIEEALKKTYSEVFKEGLGRCTKRSYLATIPNVRPVFCRSRLVPHAALEAVNAELNRLEQMGVITPVNHSEWAAPIVCVKKQNGKLRNLLAVFGRITVYGFEVRVDKCAFSKPEIRYLGFILYESRRRPDPEKIEAIKNMEESKDVTQLRAFLGMVTYYSSFLTSMKISVVH